MSDKGRYLIVLVIIVIIIVFGFLFLRGGGERRATKPNSLQPIVLKDYADKPSYVRMTTDGKINGEDIHRQIRITVAANERILEIIQGYNGNVIESKNQSNTKEAYNVFLNAINTQGFIKERRTSQKDETGVCPLGWRYIFELYDDKQQVLRLWSTTCSGQGTFGGNVRSLTLLFQRQITDYGRLTNNVDL